MSKTSKVPKKIKEAIETGKLIPHWKVLDSFSSKDKEEILERARYLRAAIELRRLRKKMKLSQAALAKKMDVKREFISRIESGQQNITLETLYRIAEATGKKFEIQFK